MSVKKLIAVILLAATVLTLAGCAVKQREFKSKKQHKQNLGSLWTTESEKEETMPATVATMPPETTAATTPPETTAATEPQGPQIICAMYDMSGETAASQLYFYDNSTFAMIVNLYEGYGTFYGIYSRDPDGTYHCSVTGKDFSGFYGEHLSSFSMFPSGGGYVIFLHNVDYVGMMFASDFFYVGG